MTPYIGEIRILPYTFTPVNWAPCNGQLLNIAQYQALYSIIGTTYGGNGTSDFRLPDLRGRVPLSQGTRPGLSSYQIGQMVGTETVTLTGDELPRHSHGLHASTEAPDTASPVNALPAKGPTTIYAAPDPAALKTMEAETIRAEGGGRSHNNMAPFMAMQFCISLVGIYPDFS